MRYRECPLCGAALDAGEICDCKKSPPDADTPEGDREKYHTVILTEGKENVK